MMTTKRHMQGRKGRAAMELGKQRFVKQAHLEKEEREQAKFEAAWAAAKRAMSFLTERSPSVKS